MMSKEFCIMNDNPPYWRNFRFPGSERHEVFEGRVGNRNKSIKDGLVIFLTPELHRTGKHSIHLSPKEWYYLKRLAQCITRFIFNNSNFHFNSFSDFFYLV